MVDAMRALVLTGFDEPSRVTEVPVPRAGPGEVLIRVGAASVNAYDTFVAAGAMRDYLPYDFPVVLGNDVAGTVEAIGPGVEGFAPGQRVFGTIGQKASVHDGSFGELASAEAAALAPTPDAVDDVRAGSLGVAGTTAMNAVEAVAPADGATVLILGATGGVGSFAIQLAAERGARVIASVRPGDEAFVTDLGADATVDYTGDVAAAIRERHPDGVDALIDLVHRDPSDFAAMAGLVRPGGRATSVVGGAGEATELGGVAVSNVGGNSAHLTALADRVAHGTLRVPVRRTYPLADAADALHDFTVQHTVGKLVIVVP